MSEQSPNEIKAHAAILEAAATLSATVVTRKNLSVPHLLGAARFAREFGALSAANTCTEFGPLSEDFIRLGTAVVLLSVSAVESYLNERLADAQDVIDGSPGANPVKAFAASQLPLWTPAKKKAAARSGVLAKAQTYLEMRGERQMNPTDAVWENFDALRELRNALHHFSPEWTSLELEHQRVSQKLTARFTPWEWWNGSEVIFPNAWASHSCAVWAVRSAWDFIDLHSTRAKLPTPLVPDFYDRLKTS